MKKAYITGNTNFIAENTEKGKEQLQQFYAAAAVLEEKGYKVVNPNTDLPARRTTEFTLRMQNKIKALMYCDVVVALPGWEKCKEAKTEIELALNIKMEVVDFTTMEPFRTNVMVLTEINGQILNVRL